MRFIFYFFIPITTAKIVSYNESFYCNELPDKYVNRDSTPWLVLLLVIGCPKDQNQRSAASFPDDCLQSKQVTISENLTVFEYQTQQRLILESIIIFS